MKTNPIKGLRKQGQSLWLDNIRRALITSGELKRLIEEGLTGVTSNPTIFEKAVAGSSDYDEQMRLLISEGKKTLEIMDALTIRDIQMVADLFLPVYEKTNGEDGFVSIELNPKLAHHTKETIEAAKALHPQLNRRNVMIKVPATEEGVPAIEALTAEGISINVTLLFSLERYEQVARAYIAGLRGLLKRGQPVGSVRSVASVFVSRIDTTIDWLLDARIQGAKAEEEQKVLKALLGKAGIANAKLIYQKFKEIFQDQDFLELQGQGAHIQRVLWGSTGTKNPHYSDVLYVEELIGPNTVNTVPPATLIAFRDHGKVRPSLEEDLEGARATHQKLAELGIDLQQITHQLQEEGVKSFDDSFKKLTCCIAAKRESMLAGKEERFSVSLGHYEEKVKERLRSLDKQKFSERLWAKDPSLWKSEPEIQKEIKNRLGWLTITEVMMEHAEELMEFGRSIKDAGLTDVVFLGMGGSSLCPEVCRKTYGVMDGYLDLHVLDSTDPATILNVEKSVNLKKTLFIVASKSGATLEVDSLYRYFSEKLQASKDGSVGDHFVAITDPGTPLEKLAQAQRFRWIFLNPSDIGGRYSALSYFGLVPAALIGIDIKAFLDRAEERIQASSSCIPAEENPGIHLGAILGEIGKGGRDKVTFMISPAIGTFGYWVEQLLAESTGKEGKGLVPIEGEAIGEPAVYRDDRIFVCLRVDSSPDGRLDQQVQALQGTGHPFVKIRLRDSLDLAQEFFRWEMATAVAGAILRINPFDEPNVTESKENTRKVLEEFQAKGKLPLRKTILEEQGIRLYSSLESRLDESLKEALLRFLGQSKASDYVALMAYLERSDLHEMLLQRFRILIRDRTHLATTLGYGPRFLHSTGQLHKGGPNTGLFIQITAEDQEDLSIPGAPYGFSLLKQAQALGDTLSLTNRGRRVLEIRLSRDVEADLRNLVERMETIRRS